MLTVKSRDGQTIYKVKMADNVAVRGIGEDSSQGSGGIAKAGRPVVGPFGLVSISSS